MADTLPPLEGKCPACGCPPIAHDGVGCTICPPTDCDLVGDDFLERTPDGFIPNDTGLTVDELDQLHAGVGLGQFWQDSERRAELIADEEARTIEFPYCTTCKAYAHPDHPHEEPAHARHTG